MTVKLVDLKRDRRTISCPIPLGLNEDGEEVFEELVVTYRPSAYTPAAERQFNETQKGEWKQETGIDFILCLVVSWDLEGEDDQPYPLEKEALAVLPSHFLTAVIKGVGEDMGKDRAPSNDS